jgi:hypothetical protein
VPITVGVGHGVLGERVSVAVGVLPLAVLAAVDVGDAQHNCPGFAVHAQRCPLPAGDVGKIASHVGSDDVKVVAAAVGEAACDPPEALLDLGSAGPDRTCRSDHGHWVQSCPHGQPGLHVAARKRLFHLDVSRDDGAEEVVEFAHSDRLSLVSRPRLLTDAHAEWRAAARTPALHHRRRPQLRIQDLRQRNRSW